ncbi:MAG: hypothetical protein LUE98_17670 [Tannerellaceae bacterium]|nr:hypothetical protein [Tannerellaceae bacterium]
MSNKKFGKGIYFSGIVLLFIACYLVFYTCRSNEKELTEAILPEEIFSVATVPDELPVQEVVPPTEEVVVEPKPVIRKPVQPVISKVEKIEKEEENIPEDVNEESSIAVPFVEEEKAVEEIPIIIAEPEITLPEETDLGLPVNKKTFNRGIELGVFIPKGLWVIGGTFSYAEASIDDYKFLVLKDI